MNDSTVKTFVKAIKAEKKDPSPYDTTAKVTRVEGNTAWVHISGGVDETPVRMTVNAEVGDEVQVRVGGGKAWITGNATAPPTDDKTALLARIEGIEAKQKAREAAAKADVANDKADTATQYASDALDAASGSLVTDTLHYLATSLSSGVTIHTAGWTTTPQTISENNPYLWTYHTYTKASGTQTNTTPVIIGTYGKDGTSVTILGSYNTLAELQAAHPTGDKGDAYMVAGDLYVWNGSAWENVGQIQGPKGDKGATGTSITAVQPLYGLSTSTTVAPSTWSTSLTYETGKYIWTREKISYNNNTTGYSTAIYNQALTQACSDAMQALEVAQEVNQYMWHTETDTGTGAGTHITAIPQEDFEADPNNGGYNSLFDNIGMKIRKGLKALASYGLKTVIGDEAGTRVEIQNDAIEMLDENDVRAFRVKNGTQTQQVQVVKNASTFQFISDGTSGTYTLPATPVAGTPIIVTLTREGANSNVTATFTFPYGTAYDNTISGMRIVYNGNLAITVTNVTGTGLDILGGTVEYTQLTTNSVVEIPATMLIQDEDFTKFLFNPQFSVDGLSPYNSRVEYDYDGLDGGYIDIGKWRYVHLPMELNTTLSASNYYAIVSGFAVPAGLSGHAALSAFSPKNGGVYSAYINSYGRLCVVTGATRLVAEDVLVVSGWYLKA